MTNCTDCKYYLQAEVIVLDNEHEPTICLENWCKYNRRLVVINIDEDYQDCLWYKQKTKVE